MSGLTALFWPSFSFCCTLGCKNSPAFTAQWITFFQDTFQSQRGVCMSGRECSLPRGLCQVIAALKKEYCPSTGHGEGQTDISLQWACPWNVKPPREREELGFALITTGKSSLCKQTVNWETGFFQTHWGFKCERLLKKSNFGTLLKRGNYLTRDFILNYIFILDTLYILLFI